MYICIYIRIPKETAWNKLKRLFSGIQEEIPSVDLGNVTWTWEWHPKVFVFHFFVDLWMLGVLFSFFLWTSEGMASEGASLSPSVLFFSYLICMHI